MHCISFKCRNVLEKWPMVHMASYDKVDLWEHIVQQILNASQQMTDRWVAIGVRLHSVICLSFNYYLLFEKTIPQSTCIVYCYSQLYTIGQQIIELVQSTTLASPNKNSWHASLTSSNASNRQSFNRSHCRAQEHEQEENKNNKTSQILKAVSSCYNVLHTKKL